MSCEGWSVGDRCRASVEFVAQGEKINAGDEGEVKEKDPRGHELDVYWDLLLKTLRLTHEQIHYLDRIYEDPHRETQRMKI